MRNLVALLPLLLLYACSPTSQSIELFDGSSLKGWHMDIPAMDAAPDTVKPFLVRNNYLVSLGNPQGHLITDKSYKNYRLEVRYRFAGEPGNCGVLVHASTPRSLYEMFPKSLEVQMMHKNAGDFWCIVEDIKVPDMEKRRGPKAEWGITEGKKRRILNLTDGSEKPLGEWNDLTIECLEDKIKVWLNCDLVNEGYDCTVTSGQIAVQAEGSEVEFEKIVLTPITELTEKPNEASYYTLADYPSVPKADVHVHVWADRTTFAEQAQKDQFKLVNIVVDGAGSWQSIEEQFEYAILQQKAYPEQFKVITSFSIEGFHQADWKQKSLAWIDQCFDRGAIGIKVWKNIGMVLKDTDESNVMLDDQRLDDIFTHLEQTGKIVIGHLGEPLNCWLPLEEMTTNNDRSYFEEHPQYHMYLHPDLPSYEDQMEARNNRLDKHPKLHFVGAHMASIEWSVDSLAAWFDRYPEATVDLAARIGQVFWQTQQDREKVRNFFIDYQDRLLYATDIVENGSSTPEELIKSMQDIWLRDWQYFVSGEEMESDLVNGSFQGIQLPKSVVDKIYFENAQRVFGF